VDDLRDLTLILKSRFPLVTVETHEEQRVLGLLEQACNLNGWALFAWTVTSGLRRVGQSDHVPVTSEPMQALRHIAKTGRGGVYVLLDAHPYLDNPVHTRLVREIAHDYARVPRTLVLVSHALKLPPELERLAARFTLSVPDLEAIRALAKKELDLWKLQQGTPATGDTQVLETLCRHLVGLPLEDARRILRGAIRDDGQVTEADLARTQKQKFELLNRDSVVRLELDTARFSDVGGLENLKRWLGVRRQPFVAGVAGVDRPKGVLLLGVQGGGKSLAAKAVAGTWGVPLLSLDVASLYNKFHGESERNLREALKTAEALAPCVLWIDEIEKGLAFDRGGEADGGVSRRMLGTLITWMAERAAPVFVVATANDITQLPPELMRKGRMDEVFFVDLPAQPVRRQIFEIHLRRRGLDPAAFDLDGLASGCAGYSGAEIEQAVVSSLYEAAAEGVPVTSRHILDELARTRPLSVLRAEELAALRQWASERAVPA
jgi:SpoVK/Ycf46/Vps4 family AAA+-type ATPase